MKVQNDITISDQEYETPCSCGAIIRYTPLLINSRECFKPTICELCSARQSEEIERNRAEMAARMRESDWNEICPPLYQGTDLARLPTHYRNIVDRWKMGPIAPAFIGDAGQGKTRASFEILRRKHFDGVRVFAISARRFAWAASRQFDNDVATKAEAREIISNCRGVRLLLFDDIGKERMTDTVEGELYDLLEHRTSNLLPTIWTANASGEELLSMFSKDRGEPILRRLAEFSEIPTQGRNKKIIETRS